MTDILETNFSRYGGVVLTEALHESGMNSHAIATLVARGELVHVRRGAYALGEVWQKANSDERYRMFVRATALCADGDPVLSHQSAAALHGLPTIGGWPKAVHTIDTDATGGSNARFTTSHRSVPVPDTVTIGGFTVTSLPRTLIDVASSTSLLVGVTMVDHALRIEQERVVDEHRRGIRGVPALTKERLFAELDAVRPAAGAGQVARAIEFGNGLAANPGESMSRVRMFELGYELPELQVCFRNVDGHDYWVDFYWRGVRKIGEFDGKFKYMPGEILGDRDPSEVVWNEKRREDALRRHADSFARWWWDIAISPRLFDRFLSEHDVPRA